MKYCGKKFLYFNAGSFSAPSADWVYEWARDSTYADFCMVPRYGCLFVEPVEKCFSALINTSHCHKMQNHQLIRLWRLLARWSSNRMRCGQSNSFFQDFANAFIFSVPKWTLQGYKRCCGGEVRAVPTHQKESWTNMTKILMTGLAGSKVRAFISLVV